VISILSLLLIPIWNRLRQKLVEIMSASTQLAIEGLLGIIILVAFNLYLHQDLIFVWSDQMIGTKWGFEINFLETAISGTLFLLFLKMDYLPINLKNTFVALFFIIAFAAPSFLQFLLGALLFAGLFIDGPKEKKLIYLNILIISMLEIVRNSLSQQMNIIVDEFAAVFQVIITIIVVSYLLRFLQKNHNSLYRSSIGLVLAIIFFEKFFDELPQGPLLQATLSLFIVISFIYLGLKSFLVNRTSTLEELFAEATFVFFLFALRFSDLPLFAVYLGGQMLFYHIYNSLNSSETTRLRQLSSLMLKLFLVGFPGSVLYLSSLAFIGFVHVDSIELGIIFLSLISIRTAFNCARFLIQDKEILGRERWVKADCWLIPIAIVLFGISFVLIPSSLVVSIFNISEYYRLLKLEDLSVSIQIFYLVLTLIAGTAFYFYFLKFPQEKQNSKKVFSTAFDHLPEYFLNSEKQFLNFIAEFFYKFKRLFLLSVSAISAIFVFSMNEGIGIYQTSNRLKLKLATVLIFSAAISTLYLLRVL